MAKRIDPQIGKTYRRNGQTGLSNSTLDVSAGELFEVTGVSSLSVAGFVTTGVLSGHSATVQRSDFTAAFFNENPEY